MTTNHNDPLPGHNPTSWGPKQKLYPSWIDLVSIVAVFLGGTLIGGGVAKAAAALAASAGLALFAGYTVQFAIVIAFALYQKKTRSADRPLLRFSLGTSTAWATLWGTILVVALSVVLEPLIALFPDSHLEFLQKAIGTGGWAMMTSVVAAPILEEVLFRGVVQDGAMKKYGPAWGILIAAAIFGVIHMIPAQAVNAFFIGLVLGLVYYRTRSLIPVIAIHALNNAIAYMQMALLDGRITGTRELLQDDKTYAAVLAVAGVFVVIGCVDAAWLLRRKNRKKSAVQAHGAQ